VRTWWSGGTETFTRDRGAKIARDRDVRRLRVGFDQNLMFQPLLICDATWTPPRTDFTWSLTGCFDDFTTLDWVFMALLLIWGSRRSYEGSSL
jgi:hypothetical protein